jgi:hypothetical protein
MPTIPDQAASHHDLKSLRGLVRRYGGRWQIGRNELLHVWTAERHEGTAVRFIVAHSAAELAAKLKAAEAAS